MALKDDVVTAELANMQAAELAAKTASLGSVWDQAVASVPAGVPNGFTQEQMDAAVQAARDADAAILAEVQAKDAQALNEAMAAMQIKLDSVTAEKDAALAQDAIDKAAVVKLGESVASVQEALDKIKALILG